VEIKCDKDDTGRRVLDDGVKQFAERRREVDRIILDAR